MQRTGSILSVLGVVVLGLVAVLGVVACDEASPPTSAPTSTPDVAAGVPEGPVAQVPIGGDANDVQPRLGFRITEVHPDQKLTKEAPWHADGGDWTFADAELDGEPSVRFTFGTKYTVKPGSPFAFGDAFLAVPDAAAGRALVARFAEAFGTKAPASKGGPLHLEMRAAILGDGVARQPGGGFGGKGTWVAMKLFPEHAGTQGEVFFNYDLASKQGELAEKDATYNEDVAAVFGAAL